MTSRRPGLVLLTAAILLGAMPAGAEAQSPRRSNIAVTLGGGRLTSGAYFTGPGNLALDNSDAFAGMVQIIAPVHPSFSVVVGGVYARPEWRLSGVPLFGSVAVDGASLWFADASFRGQVPLSRTPGNAPTAFAQIGPGLAHYALAGSVLGRAVDESATNFAVALGGGIGVPLGGRVGLEIMAKDYVVSFKSVRDLAAFGVEGKRAHTLLVTANARVGL
jgi:hypothetical protein